MMAAGTDQVRTPCGVDGQRAVAPSGSAETVASIDDDRCENAPALADADRSTPQRASEEVGRRVA
jgi:hypothetical protein